MSKDFLLLGKLTHLCVLLRIIPFLYGKLTTLYAWDNMFLNNSHVWMMFRLHCTDKEDVLVNACCPGWVKTDMAGQNAPLTPDQGAETPVLCALLPSGSPTGKFWKDKVVQSLM